MRRATNGKQFDKYCVKRVTELLRIHQEKSREYAEEFDRLANFRHGAALERTIPEAYLLGLVAKHEVALRDYTRRLEQGKGTPIKQWLEKTGDVIIYMLLLEGLLMEHLTPEGLE